MKKYLTIVIFFLPLLVIGQKTITPTDSLKKYQKLTMRDRDSLNRYIKLNDLWSQKYYFKLSEKRRSQIDHWRHEQDKIDAEKRRKKS